MHDPNSATVYLLYIYVHSQIRENEVQNNVQYLVSVVGVIL